MIALDPKQEREYVCKADRNSPVADQTVFVLKALTPSDESKIDDALGQLVDGGYQINLGAQKLIALRIGLVNVRNFKDSNGNEIKPTIENGVVSDDFLQRIPKDVRAELAQEVIMGGQLSETERKNS